MFSCSRKEDEDEEESHRDKNDVLKIKGDFRGLIVRKELTQEKQAMVIFLRYGSIKMTIMSGYLLLGSSSGLGLN